MAKQILQMKYHPAKKEIEFKRFSDNVECPIRNDSKLMFYINQRGKFVLQDHGNAFFDDIKNVFDGIKELEIKVITTRLDYEDFEQMVEFYNEENNDFRITSTLLAELPDMTSTFATVKEYGEEVATVLEEKKNSLFDIPLDNLAVKDRAESFASQLSCEIANIKEKIINLKDSNVNLCFAGIYSSGKSALINSILGYKILPEAVGSETAKMFKISAPDKDEPVSIEFQILNIVAKLVWDIENEVFGFILGPTESQTRTLIQEYINEAKKRNEKLHEQLYNILKIINFKPEISSVIIIHFPISLNSESVKFTIFDTPGTDSNFSEHKEVLYEALENQSQSILIFVTNANRLEGEGNNALLNYIKEAEEKYSKTTIDMSRSIFVMNYADNLTKETREELRFKEIKNKDDKSFSIKLKDKKLLFTTALYGYPAKAKLNQIASASDEALLAAAKVTISSEVFPMGFCYRQNRFATSELATNRMIDKCEKGLKAALGENNDAKILVITSGLYALEEEIKQYGKKFASAVKAFAIIDSVDRALSKMTNRAVSLLSDNKNDIAIIDNDIRLLGKTINDSIDKVSKEVEQKGALPEDVRKKLEIDSESVQKYTDRVIAKVKEQLKGWFFGLGRVPIKGEHETKILEEQDSIIADFNRKFIETSKESLTKQKNDFIESVKTAIQEDSEITDAAKKYMLTVDPIDDIDINVNFDIKEMYNKYRRNGQFFFHEYEYLDKEGFLKDLNKEIRKHLADLADEYSNGYRSMLNSIIKKISENYKTRLNEYALDMKTMIENKEAMIKLGNKLLDSANSVKELQDKLNKIIWKEQKYD